MNNVDIEKNIKDLYRDFFRRLRIDSLNGVLSDQRELKFASYPYIGSKYSTGRRGRVLFIGLDIGKDESVKILSFKEKRMTVEAMNDVLKKMNPHIAGLYISMLFLARMNFRKLENTRSYKAVIKDFQKTNQTNLLAYTALTNLFKFVTVGRKGRAGGKDRQHISKVAEENLLLNEIRILGPRIIVLQSLSFKKEAYRGFLKKLGSQNKNTKVYISNHPSDRALHSNALKYLKTFSPSILKR